MKYSDEHINQFYEVARKLPQNVDIDTIHQLIDNPPGGSGGSHGSSFSTFKGIGLGLIMAVVTVTILFIYNPKPDLKTETLKKLDLSQDSLPKKSLNNSFKEIRAPQPPKLKDNKAEFNSNFQKSPKEKFKTNWPEDTVIFIEKLLVELNWEEAKNLGFTMIDSSRRGSFKKYGSILYNNQFQGLTSSFCRIIHGTSSSEYPLSSDLATENPATQTNHDFFAVMTGGWPYFNRPNYAIENKYLHNFEKYRHELIPVRINGSGLFDIKTHLYFLISPALFDSLPARYQFLKETFLNIRTLSGITGRKVIYYRDDIIENIKPLSLNEEQLHQIGFHFDDTIIYQQDAKGYPVSIKMWRESKSYTFIENNRTKENVRDSNQIDNGIRLLYTSDRHAYQVKAKQERISYFHQLAQEYDFLVPVLLDDDHFSPYLSGENIFWFEPNDSLFNNLPNQIAQELRSDYRYITAIDKSDLEARCTYFPICETELKIKSFKLHRNTLPKKLSVSFTFSEDMKASIEIYDRSNSLVLEIRDQNYFEGSNTESIPIKHLKPGNYTIKLTTSNGYKKAQFVIEND